MTQETTLIVVLGLGIAAIVGLAVVMRRAQSPETGLDAQVDGIIAAAVAPHLTGFSEADVLGAIRDPVRNPTVAASVRAVVVKAQLSVERVDGEWMARVELWHIGEDPEKVVKLTASFTIDWDDLPDDVRERLMRDGGEVVIPWRVAEPSESSP